MSLHMIRQRHGLAAVDVTETNLFVVGLLQVVLAAVVFGVLLLIIVGSGVATAEPPSGLTAVSVLTGVVPAVIFGGVLCV
jgi:hypothetical protein